MRLAPCVLALVSLSALAPSTVGAQGVLHDPSEAQYSVSAPAATPSEADMARARELYAEGGRRVDEGQWADALEAFEGSFRLSGVPAALFNAATTLRSMGRHRDARDLFTQLLAIEGLDDETRATADARHEEEAARVARISLTGLGGMPDARVHLDGAVIDRAIEDPMELETDSGRHAVSVLREGYVPWREELRLTDGQRVSLAVSLSAIEVDREEVWESPVFWTVVVAILAAGGIVTAIVLQDQAQLSPRVTFDDLVVELE